MRCEPAWQRQYMQQMCIASLQGIVTGRFSDVTHYDVVLLWAHEKNDYG